MLTGFDDAVHGVRHGECVRPVVIRNLSVILSHSQSEAEQVIQIKSKNK